MPITQTPKKDQKLSCSLVDKQIAHEFFNEKLYIAIAVWFDSIGMTETAQFFSKHSEEEREHAFRFINHSLKQGRKPELLPSTETLRTEFKDVADALQTALDQEHLTNSMVQNLYKVGKDEGTFLIEIAEEFIKEQLEETQLFTSLLNLWKICNGSRIDFEMEVMKLKCDPPKYKLGELAM